MRSRRFSSLTASILFAIVCSATFAQSESVPRHEPEDPLAVRNWAVDFSPLTGVREVSGWIVVENAVPSAASHFITVVPCRILDTRNLAGPFGGPIMAPRETRTYNVPAGPCPGIPSTASAYSLSFSVTQTLAGGGFLTAWPAGAIQPNAATMTWFGASQTLTAAAIVPAGTSSSISLYASQTTHVIIDINGYFVEGVVTNLTVGTGLTGGGTGSVSVGIANGGVGTTQLADGAVTDVKLVTLTAAGKVANSATTATSANTANAIVSRDGSGNFSAGTVTLSGNLILPTSTSTAGSILQQGIRLLHTFGDDNVFLGINAGNFTINGNSNTAIGVNALRSNVVGTGNTASGANALQFTTGDSNTGTGSGALHLNTTGGGNTASGAFALSSNTVGASNTASGKDALFSNTTGNNNTATGTNALQFNTTSEGNTASGANALQFNTGFDNTASGLDALVNNTTGSRNIALGANAGLQLTTGSNNIDIGSEGVAGEASTIRIGSVSQTRTFIAGVRDVTTDQANGLAVLIAANGQLGTVSSSAGVKREITGIGEGSSALLNLRPVSFLYRSDAVGIRQYGLIAEEVAEVMPELVQFSPTGEAQTVRYHFLAPLLLSEIQKQRKTIEQQRETIEDQRDQMTLFEARLAALEEQSRNRDGLEQSAAVLQGRTRK